jgi:stringent starvation protein B
MTNLPAKRDVTLALLERSTVSIHLDPRLDGVKVPSWFKNQPQLVLKIGLSMAIPIPDLEIDDAGLSCTLSFNRSPHFCSIPWQAIYALVGDDGRGMVWPDDVPEEVVAQAQVEAPKQRGHLRAVPADPPAPSAKKNGSAQAVSVKKEARRAATTNGASQKKTTRASRKKVGEDTRAPATRKRADAKRERPANNKVAAVDARDDGALGPSADQNKSRRRELPPYLRVVK